MSKYGVFLVRIFAYSVWIRKNTDQKKLRIWTLFTQWRQNVNGEIMQIWTYKKDITSYQHSLLNYTNNYCQMYANSKCYITGLNFWRKRLKNQEILSWKKFFVKVACISYTYKVILHEIPAQKFRQNFFSLFIDVSTSNHMFGRAIWDNFQKLRKWFIPKIAWTKHVITG